MKTNHYTDILKTTAAVFVLLVLIGACSYLPERKQSIVSTMVDETEDMRPAPDPAEIIPLFGLDEDKWNGASFSVRTVTDVSFTRQRTITLPAGGNRLRSNSFARDREVAAFKDSITALLDSLKTDTTGKPQSSIFLPIAEELNRLAENKAQQRILIVFSDLFENTQGGLSFYSKKTLTELRNNPDKIKAALLAKLPLKPLDGILVYIIHEPENAEADELFRLVSGFYKSMLEEQGAKVIIAANVPAPSTHTK